MRSAWAGALLVAATLRAAPLAAQNAPCAAVALVGRQTCEAAVDLVRAYHPLAGLAVSGGNPVLGTGGASGRLGSFSITLRSNAFTLSVPDLSAIGATGTIPEDDRLLAPAPLIEGMVGIYPGTESGLLAIDLLVAAQLVPNEDFTDEIRIDPDATRLGPFALGIGFGARIGIMAERGPLPAVALSVMRRSIPRIGFGDIAAGDQIAGDVDLQSWNLRLTAGRRFSALALAGGLGWSRYTGDATAQYDAPVSGQGSVALSLSQNRLMYFLDAGLDLRVVRLTGEIGYQVGKDQQLGTTFAGYDDAAGTTFYSVGLSVGL